MAAPDIRWTSPQGEWLVQAGLLDHMEDAVVGVDAGWRVRVWNRAAEEIYGWNAEDALGQHVTSVVGLAMSDQERTRIQRTAVRRGRWRGDVVAHRRDGTRVEVELIAVGVRDSRGRLSGFYSIHRDITERKRVERQLAYQSQLLENMDDAVLATDERYVLTAWNRGAERMFGWTAAEAVGQCVDDLLPSSLTKAERAAEMDTLIRTGRWRGEVTWYGKCGQSVHADELTVALRSDEGKLSGYLSIMRDISERRAARKALAGNARQQALVADLGLRGLAGDDLQALLDDATGLVARMLDVDLASVGEILPGQRHSWRAAVGWTAEALAAPHPSPADSLVSYTVRAGQPVVSDNLAADERFTISPAFARQGPVSAITTLIPAADGQFGVLTAAAREPRRFSAGDINFMQAVANVLGNAVERSRTELRLAGVREDERRRIARDLHDDALHELTNALALAIQGQLDPPAGREQECWIALTASLRRVGQRLRGSIYDLTLSHEERGFAHVVLDLIAVQGAMAGADCKIKLCGREVLPTASLGRPGIEVLRILREAITNARRHSGATSILVSAERLPRGRMRLNVSDDGHWSVGRPANRNQRHNGIINMHERAQLLGAELRILPRAAAGTTVSLEWAPTAQHRT